MAHISEWWRWLKHLMGELWVRVTIFSLAGILLAFLARRFSGYVPDQFELSLAAGSVESLLNILASSMLAVTTFSLSIVRSSYSSVTNNATPRATQLLVDDPIAKDTLGTFVGSFIFSIFGIVGLSGGFYDDKGRIILFLATLFVIILVTYRLVVWISATNKMGRMDDTISRIEHAAMIGLTRWRDDPRLGCAEPMETGKNGMPVYSDKSGYIHFIDCIDLQNTAGDLGGHYALHVQPGSYVQQGMPVGEFYFDDAEYSDSAVESVRNTFRSAVDITTQRNKDIDPYGGLIALSEVASRALSPAVNDPGTAISIVQSGVRCFEAYQAPQSDDAREPNRYDRVHMRDLDFNTLLRLFFDPIARDGASLVEVQIPIQRALRAIGEKCNAHGKHEVAQRARVCLRRANKGLDIAADRELLAAALRPEFDWISLSDV